MELVKKSNFYVLEISFRGKLFPPPAVSVGKNSAFPRTTPDRKRNKSGHLRTCEPANAINPGIPGLEIPQTQ